jgi:hypothetical protein
MKSIRNYNKKCVSFRTISQPPKQEVGWWRREDKIIC